MELNKTYLFRVYAVNANGNGSYSVVTVHDTPSGQQLVWSHDQDNNGRVQRSERPMQVYMHMCVAGATALCVCMDVCVWGGWKGGVGHEVKFNYAWCRLDGRCADRATLSGSVGTTTVPLFLLM